MDGDIRHRYRRDYTKQPLGPVKSAIQTPRQAAAPVPQQSETLKSHNKSSSKRWPKLLATLIIIALIGASSYWYYTQQNVIPSQIRSQAEVPILYPAKLPADYKVVKSSFNVTNGNIITFYAQNTSNDRINFTVQARPTTFDFDKFYSQVISNATKFNTPLGEAAVGKANGHLLGSLATTKSWMLVTGSDNNVDADKIQTALSSVKEIN